MLSAIHEPFGLFAGQTDVGPVKIPGTLTYDSATQQYTLSGSGANLGLGQDVFSFAYQRLSGDFILRARVRFIGQGTDPRCKLGLIARTTLRPDSACAGVAVQGEGLASLQFRRTAGALTEELRSAQSAPDMLQLTRVGHTLTMSVTRFGEVFTEELKLDLDLGQDLFVGLFVTSHAPDVLEQAVFSEVRIIRPAWEGLVPYRDFLGSCLEILDTQTGHSQIVYRTPEPIEAPNWTSDGNSLIYNSRGKLYRFDLSTGASTLLDTGFATRNNNDHVLSFDGQTLGISHHAEESGGQSIVYVLPATGGTPRQVTPRGPSYLHGFSPDGRTLVYTAERGDGNYDIYSIPIIGGPETRLTTAPGLDDGSEFSPDGQYLYFNSVRSGLMQLWRMRPDGSAQEQVTNDGLNNWFPHLSRDGQWILFLSYGADVPPGDHPYYQQVYLRLMPAAGGTPKVVAYVYGGQGTINVPSWSPDHRHAAFVSNTKR